MTLQSSARRLVLLNHLHQQELHFLHILEMISHMGTGRTQPSGKTQAHLVIIENHVITYSVTLVLNASPGLVFNTATINQISYINWVFTKRTVCHTLSLCCGGHLYGNSQDTDMRFHLFLFGLAATAVQTLATVWRTLGELPRLSHILSPVTQMELGVLLISAHSAATVGKIDFLLTLVCAKHVPFHRISMHHPRWLCWPDSKSNVPSFHWSSCH